MDTSMRDPDSMQSTLNKPQPQDPGEVFKMLLLDNVLTSKLWSFPGRNA
jgi:hypothetical protein